MDYKDSGVDIDLGNEASKIFYAAAKETFDIASVFLPPIFSYMTRS